MQTSLRQKIAVTKILVVLCLRLFWFETDALRLLRAFMLWTADSWVSHLEVLLDQIFDLALDGLALFVVCRRHQMLFKLAAEAEEPAFLFHLIDINLGKSLSVFLALKTPGANLSLPFRAYLGCS